MDLPKRTIGNEVANKLKIREQQRCIETFADLENLAQELRPYLVSIKHEHRIDIKFTVWEKE
jgi:DNA mismatch repair ATPase MutS